MWSGKKWVQDGWKTQKPRAYVVCPDRCGGWAWADRRLACCARCGAHYASGGKQGAAAVPTPVAGGVASVAGAPKAQADQASPDVLAFLKAMVV
eukprot:12278046-Alexandrium_andersonii.AAC.1